MSQRINYGTKNSVKSLVAQCILKTVMASLIAFLLYVSVTIIAVGSYTKEIGYTILYSEDGENYEEVYKHYYSNGEDAKFKDYDGKENYYKTPIRSEVDGSIQKIFMWIGQGLSLIIWFAMLYGVLWKAGDADANMAELGKHKRDIYKGLRVGIFADIPFAAAYLLLVITSVFKIFPKYPAIYKIVTYFMYAFNDTFIKATGNGFEITFGGVLGSILVLLPLPVIAAYAYYMGEKHIIVKEKILYKREEK